jgi:hypothetical protein
MSLLSVLLNYNDTYTRIAFQVAYASEGSRFLTTSAMGLGLDVVVMQPLRVTFVAIILVAMANQVDTCSALIDFLEMV